jgi:hypothetical protein
MGLNWKEYIRMTESIHEITSIPDAERLTDAILRALRTREPVFNPFIGSLIELSDNSIMFHGETMRAGEAQRAMTEYIWKNRGKINRQLKRWVAAGAQVADCGC